MKKFRKLQRADALWVLALGMIILLQFWWLPGAPKSAEDSWSASSQGKLGFYRAIVEIFPDVQRSSELDVSDQWGGVLLMIGPESYPDHRQQQEISDWIRYREGVLLFAPNFTETDPSLDLLRIDLFQSPDVKTSINQFEEGETFQEDEAASINLDLATYLVESGFVEGTVPWKTRSIFGDRENRSIVVKDTEGEPMVMGWRTGSGYLVCSNSPYPFSNQAMIDGKPGELAIQLLKLAYDEAKALNPTIEPTITIDESFNTKDSYQYSGILLSPALRSGSLQLLMLGLLIAWFGFHRFGPAIQKENRTRKNMIDSAVAVGNLQYRSPDCGVVVGRYLEYMQSHLRKRYGNSVQLTDHAAIAQRSGMNVAELSEKLIHAQAMAQSSQQVSSQDAAKVIHWLSVLHNRLSTTKRTMSKN